MAKTSNTFVSKHVPLYYQLENLLREKIASGKFSVGDRLPTESELIEQYGVSRITVRQALTALANEGLIERRQGRGTFIAERRMRNRPFEGHTHLTGSLDEVIAMGLNTPVKVIEIHQLEASPHEAELLGLQAGDPIYRIKRLRLREGKPYSYIVNCVPAEIGAQLTREELSTGTLLELIERKCKVHLKEAKQQITAALADPYVAGLLDVHIGSALLSIERTVYTVENRPVEYVHVLYRTDLYSYTVHLTRDESHPLVVTPKSPKPNKRK